MRCWPFEVGPTSPEAVRQAIDDDAWQEFRKSLKGLDTQEKLKRLENYRGTNPSTRVRIQVDNYLKALRRGGQLDEDFCIKRER